MTITWTMKQAKRDFDRGLIDGFDLAISDHGFARTVSVELYGQTVGAGPLVDSRNEELRLFKSVDAAISALLAIGFEFRVLSLRNHAKGSPGA